MQNSDVSARKKDLKKKYIYENFKSKMLIMLDSQTILNSEY